MMDQLKEITMKTQAPFILWLGPKSFLVVDHPDDIQVVMNSKGCIEKSYIYRFFNGGLGFFSASGRFKFYFLAHSFIKYIKSHFTLNPVL